MRKLFWSCMVVALIIAGGAYVWMNHPGEKIEPGNKNVQEFAEQTAQYVRQQFKPLVMANENAEEEQEVVEEVLMPKPVLGVDELDDGFELPPVAGEAPDNEHPPIHLSTDDEIFNTVPVPSELQEQPGSFVPTAPRVMPLCEKDQARCMPKVDDSEKEENPFPEAKTTFVPIGDRWIKGSTEESELEDEQGCSDYHHSDYPRPVYCPYSGKCYTPKPVETKPAGTKKKSPEYENQSWWWDLEQLQHRLTAIQEEHVELQLKQEVAPEREDIDTMECRPSDIDWKREMPEL